MGRSIGDHQRARYVGLQRVCRVSMVSSGSRRSRGEREGGSQMLWPLRHLAAAGALSRSVSCGRIVLFVMTDVVRSRRRPTSDPIVCSCLLSCVSCADCYVYCMCRCRMRDAGTPSSRSTREDSASPRGRREVDLSRPTPVTFCVLRSALRLPSVSSVR